jgi:hypothetical protein
VAWRGVEPTEAAHAMGHEYVGFVEEVGSEVTSLKPGQFVVGSFATSDNTCANCRNGFPSSCLNRDFMSTCQADYVRIPNAQGTLVATDGVPGEQFWPGLKERPMQITRSSIDTVKGPADWFTGDVYIDPVAPAPAPSRVTAALVHFMPGARAPTGTATHWQSSSPKRLAPASAGAGRSRPSGSATACCARPTRSTGTVPRPTGSWFTWPSTRATPTTTSSTG